MVSLQTDLMKTRVAAISLSALAGLGLLAGSAMNIAAQISVAPNASTTASSVQAAPVRLSYGVADVLKLAKAHVSEDTIVAYVANSGTAYNLTVDEIVYLKEQGVSDRVLTAMLDQRNKLAEAAAQTAQLAPAPPQANYPDAGAPQYAPAAVQPSATDMQTAPAAAPASSVYVIPSSSPTYGYPGYYPSYSWGYPYYGGYYGYGYPGVGLSLGFGWGGGWCGSGWSGGYRGWYGGYHGGYGGYHGGYGGGHHH
jgi:hypothetical protein